MEIKITDLTISLSDVVLTVLAVLGIILIVYLIKLIKKVIDTMGKVDNVIDDANILSAIAANKAQKVDGIIDGVGETVSNIVSAAKGNKSFVSAMSNIVNAGTNAIGIVRNMDKEKGKKKSKKEK